MWKLGIYGSKNGILKKYFAKVRVNHKNTARVKVLMVNVLRGRRKRSLKSFQKKVGKR